MQRLQRSFWQRLVLLATCIGLALTLQFSTAVAQSAINLNLSASLTANSKPLNSGLHWRIYEEMPSSEGKRTLVTQSDDAAPAFQLPAGNYYVHVGFGLAGVSKRVTIDQKPITERVVLNAGAISLIPINGSNNLAANKVSMTIYVPEKTNSEAKVVASNVKPGDIIPLPEGRYHLKSVYLDTVGVGALDAKLGEPAPTNSVVTADINVQTGKLTEVTLRHRAATLTLKLVNKAGGEALANSSFTVLTPGGDVIRELIGAFPSLVLAEGDYVAIARHDNKTYQGEFQVQSAFDHDIEIIAK